MGQSVGVGAVLVTLPLHSDLRTDHVRRLHLTVDKHQFGGVLETDFISIVKPLSDSTFWIERHRRNVFDFASHRLCADDGVSLPHHDRDQRPKGESTKHSYANSCFTKFFLKQKQAISKIKPGCTHVQ